MLFRSPSDAPWRRVNVYNFQDVSSWKDLGPKFALQVYRDFVHLRRAAAAGSGKSRSDNDNRGGAGEGQREGEGEGDGAQAFAFLRELFPTMLRVMVHAQQFDEDGDGMIENSGFPDQVRCCALLLLYVVHCACCCCSSSSFHRPFGFAAAGL